MRASDGGCLPMSFEKYLALIDWTGRQNHRQKRRRVPGGISPILERFGFRAPVRWLAVLTEYAERVLRETGIPSNQDVEIDSCAISGPADRSSWR